MKKRLIKFILILGSVVLAVIIFKELKTYQKSKPICENCNVLLISIDTLAAKHMPCYGYDKDTSPNLCQFGKDNFLFSNAYSQSSWTRPSQTSVLTGLHPSTHGVNTPYMDNLLPKYSTIAETLKSYGYTTYYYGPGTDTSWDASVIRGFDYMEQGLYETNSLNHWRGALDVLEKNQKNKIPTFMFLHTYYVHSPYIPGTENLKFVDKEKAKKYPEIPLTQNEYSNVTMQFKDELIRSLEERILNSKTTESLRLNTEMLNKIKKAKTLMETIKSFYSLPQYEISSYSNFWYLDQISKVNDYQYVSSLYDEKINQLDDELKEILGTINDKFEKDTIVVIYSDHGETFGERGSYAHCYKNTDCLYDETIRVPMIIRVPGLKSKKIEEVSQGIDIYPTIMRLIGKKGPQNLEGESLVGLMTGKEEKPKRSYIVVERDLQKAIIDSKWKMYFKYYKHIVPDNTELYYLGNDLYEQHDLSKERDDIVKIKTDQLKDFMSKKIVTQIKYAFPEWIDEVKKEKLIKEGYF